MAQFSVFVLTAVPTGLSADAQGAYVKIDGREALLRSIEMFLNRDNIKQIHLVVSSEHQEEARRKYGGHLSFSGVKLLVAGPKWIDQLAAADAKVVPDCTHVLIHDAARCAVPYSDIDILLESAEKSDAVVLASAMRFPVLEIDDAEAPLAIHRPGTLLQLQTPQVYTRKVFAEMASTRQEPHPSRLRILQGSPLNARLSSGADVSFVKAMINLLPKPKAAPLSPFEEAKW